VAVPSGPILSAYPLVKATPNHNQTTRKVIPFSRLRLVGLPRYWLMTIGGVAGEVGYRVNHAFRGFKPDSIPLSLCVREANLESQLGV